MKMNLIKLCFMIILGVNLLLTGCTKTTQPVNGLKFNYTGADTIEAKEFALWLSGNMSPDADLVNELLYNLAYLRTDYSDTFPVVKVRFLPPWKTSELSIKFDDTTSEKIRRGLYQEWRKFDLEYQPVDTIYPDNLGWSFPKFKPFLHPRRLADLYKTLPGVITAEPKYIGFSGFNTYPIFPRRIGIGNEISYVFTGGNIRLGLWYFKTINRIPKYIGYWDKRQPSPEWYNEARLNIENFLEWDGLIITLHKM